MDFRECVISSVDDSQIIAAFNRLEQEQWSKDELRAVLLNADLETLNEAQRHSVARYLAFVHANIWQRVRAMRSRRKAWYAMRLGAEPTESDE